MQLGRVLCRRSREEAWGDRHWKSSGKNRRSPRRETTIRSQQHQFSGSHTGRSG
ncbi:hypothetical protein [Phormidium sp. CCY1219]|uniref:hypothetical protein n=1 Tax=Phormidium sp. CCY1219 TaxID=2886104 RepID=UPI002D1E8D18|nr:hypothetical protein [Phormidium sp. CCY1219]MEB3831620.1 hypothetical protein [Phormidium sp. CCY1219]